ncbi:MAG: hypothetical protein OIF54_13975 [Cohaesibacter sp.]|nr:hypothetical protein [Cohaesibacter sp.]
MIVRPQIEVDKNDRSWEFLIRTIKGKKLETLKPFRNSERSSYIPHKSLGCLGNSTRAIMRLSIFLLSTFIFCLAICSLALLLSSSLAASAFIGLFFSVVMLPALFVAAFYRLNTVFTVVLASIWIAMILFLPALSGTFNYSAGTEQIYHNGVPEKMFFAKVVATTCISAAIAQIFSMKINLKRKV